ncbi:nitrilase [Pusillimonas sp. T2]|nr:nitrilase [Pusillimonas sp. T2]
MERNMKVGVVQTGSVYGDTAATIDKAEQWIAKAADQACELVVFPEAFVGGYPKGGGFGVVVGVRTEAGRDEFASYFQASIVVPGPETDRLSKAAAKAGAFVVMGVIERELGTLYCTVLFFSPTGELLGKHRKLMPTAGERVVWGYGDGSTLPVFDTPAGKMGAVLCWENYMPMLRMAMYAQDIAVYCTPTADDRPTWVPSMQHIAREGRCYVLSSCQFIRRGDFPADYDCTISNDNDAILMRGGSVIVDPLGTVIAGPVFDEDALLTAIIDPVQIARGKLDFDVAGSYARPDVFQLTVNQKANAPVVFKDSASVTGGSHE